MIKACFFKNLLIAILFILPNYFVLSQVGKTFPLLKGTTLEDKTVTLPGDTKGKFTLLGMAYSKKAEEELQTWYQPVFTTFIEKGKPGLFTQSYDVNLYFVPMFTGVNQAATDVSRKKMKAGIDKSLLPFVLTYRGELTPYKETLNFDKKDTPYFFVLGKDGKILYVTSGIFTEEKLEKVEEFLETEEVD